MELDYIDKIDINMKNRIYLCLAHMSEAGLE